MSQAQSDRTRNTGAVEYVALSRHGSCTLGRAAAAAADEGAAVAI